MKTRRTSRFSFLLSFDQLGHFNKNNDNDNDEFKESNIDNSIVLFKDTFERNFQSNNNNNSLNMSSTRRDHNMGHGDDASLTIKVEQLTFQRDRNVYSEAE